MYIFLRCITWRPVWLFCCSKAVLVTYRILECVTKEKVNESRMSRYKLVVAVPIDSKAR